MAPADVESSPCLDVAVIIPALNEEASIGLVLDDLPCVRQVFVVDNGCTDNTTSVASAAGAQIVPEPQRGYGAACLAGIEAARNMTPPPRIIVFVDADYSDHPEELQQLVAPILANEQDMVLGSRLLGNRERGAMPPQSVYGNRLACFLMWFLFRAHYTDLGPFRAIGFEQLESLKMCDRNFGWTIEMQIKAHRSGLRYCELPASYRRRVGVSKISGTISGTLRAGSKILYSIAKYGWVRSS